MPAATPPAVTVGIALLVAEALGHVTILPLAALSVVAGIVTCRTRSIAVLLTVLYTATPATAGFDLPTWLIAFTGFVLLLVLTTGTDLLVARGAAPAADHEPVTDATDPVTDDVDPVTDATDQIATEADPAERSSALIPFLAAAALWSAAPDTELPLAAAGALFVPAVLDLLRSRIGRPDAPSMATVLVGAAIGFVGRPAGAVVLALTLPPWLIAARPGAPTTPSPGTGPARHRGLPDRRASDRRDAPARRREARSGHSSEPRSGAFLPLEGRRRIHDAALATTLVLLIAGCRTGGLRHHLDRSLPPTLVLGGLSLAIAVAVLASGRSGRSHRPRQP